MNQNIKFCTATDGVSIAYASIGTGPPFVKAANWMNHLEHDATSPVWRHVIDEFSRDHEFIRYDERGTGLSDRTVEGLSLDAFVGDLEAVVDARGLDRFPLFAISQGGAVAISYAVKHPAKVSHLIMLGAFATGWNKSGLSPELLAQRHAEVTLIRQGWGSRNPASRQFWTTLCLPDGRPDESLSFNEMQRASASPEHAARIFEAIGDFDVSDLLPTLDLPVLVMHAREDATVPFEEGRKLASAIPNARFVPLESRNHLLMHHEAAWPRFVHEVRKFLGRETPEDAVSTPTRLLKTCPTCSRTYADEAMLYCLDDGSKLIHAGSMDEAPTVLLS